MGAHRDPASKRWSRLADRAVAEQALIVRVGSRVTQLRAHLGGMTIAELARRAGLHPSYLGEVERGQKNPTLATLGRIASALDVSLSDLVSELPLSFDGTLLPPDDAPTDQ